MPSFQPNSNIPVTVLMATMPMLLPQSALNPELLGITKWLQALDADDKRCLDGICFSDFRHLLDNKGFFKIT